MNELIKAALEELAAMAKEGTRALIVVGKVTDQKKYKANDYGPAQTVCPCVAAEGSTVNLAFDDGATVPGRGFEGAFLVDPFSIYKGKNGVSVNCLGFA